jgi:hypothetical protein
VLTLVNVAFAPITFCKEVSPRTVNVLVTVLDAATNPPNSESVEVAEAPRAVTVARVSVSASKYAGQLVPVLRQTVLPFTKSWVVETTPEAKRLVVVTLKPVAFEKLMFPPLIVETFRVEMVPVVAERTVVLRAVVVTLVNVAFAPITFCRLVFPRTVKVEVTVELDDKKPAYN